MLGLSAVKRVARLAETDRLGGGRMAKSAHNAPDAGAPGFALAEGIVAGTRIATTIGWRPVESLAPGDMVMTFDHGMRPVIRIERLALWSGHSPCPRHLRPLAVPVGALGNSAPMLLLPEQTVLVESDLAETVFGDPFVLIPAAALDGYRGIGQVAPHRTVDIVVIQFAEAEVVYANGTGMIHCGSVRNGGLAALMDGEDPYTALPMEVAREIVAGLIEEDYAAHC